MKRYFVTLIALFVSLAAQPALAKSGTDESAIASECEKLTASSARRIQIRRTEILAAAMDYNARVPQMNLVIILAAVAEFLKDPIPLESLREPISKAEMDVIVERFNRIHEAYGIPVATEGFVTSRPIRKWIQVSDVARLEEVILRSTFISITKGVGNLNFGDKTYEAFRGMNPEEVIEKAASSAAVINAFFSNPKYATQVGLYKAVGAKINEYFKSPAFNHVAADYKNEIARMVKAQLAVDRSTPADTGMISYEMQEHLKAELMPNLDAIPGLHPFFSLEFMYHASGG